MSVDKLLRALDCTRGPGVAAGWAAAWLGAGIAVPYAASWAHAPLLTGADPEEAALAGVVPGYDAYEDYVGVSSLEADVSLVKDRAVTLISLYRPRDRLYVYWLNATLVGNLLHVIHSEAVVEFKLVNYVAWFQAKLNMLAGGNVLYEPPLYGYWANPAVPFNYTDNMFHSSKVIAAGGVGSIYVPFTVSAGSDKLVLDVMLIPSYNTVTVWEYVAPLRLDCPPLSYFTPIYRGGLENPVYVSVKLHVLPPAEYQPDKLILPRSYAMFASESWRPHIAIPYKTVVVLPPTRLDRIVEVNVTLSPSILRDAGLDRAVVVLDISYAGGWSSWAPYSFEKVMLSSNDAGLVASVGANFYLYIGAGGVEGRGFGNVFSPVKLKPSPAIPVGRVVLQYNTTLALRGCREYYRLMLALQEPGSIPVYRLQGSYTLTPTGGDGVAVVYSLAPLSTLEQVGFPQSILALLRGSQNLVGAPAKTRSS